MVVFSAQAEARTLKSDVSIDDVITNPLLGGSYGEFKR